MPASRRSSPRACRRSACACRRIRRCRRCCARPAGRSPRRRPMPAARSARPAREHVLKSLGGRIPLIIDGGPTERGLESTIVAATGGPLRLLRPGPIADRGGSGVRRADRSAWPARQPLCAVQAAAARRDGAPRPDEFLIGFGASPATRTSALSATWSKPPRGCSTCCTRPTRRPSRASRSRPSPTTGPRRSDQRSPAARCARLRPVAAALLVRAWKLLRSFCSLGGMVARQ